LIKKAITKPIIVHQDWLRDCFRERRLLNCETYVIDTPLMHQNHCSTQNNSGPSKKVVLDTTTDRSLFFPKNLSKSNPGDEDGVAVKAQLRKDRKENIKPFGITNFWDEIADPFGKSKSEIKGQIKPQVHQAKIPKNSSALNIPGGLQRNSSGLKLLKLSSLSNEPIHNSSTTSNMISTFSRTALSNSCTEYDYKPKISHPSSSKIFANMLFSARGFDKARLDILDNAITNAGGLFFSSFDAQSRVQYIVVPLVCNNQDPIIDKTICHVTECWVERCVIEGKFYDPTQEVEFQPVLKGGLPDIFTYNFGISGYDGLERRHIRKLVEALGIIVILELRFFPPFRPFPFYTIIA